MNNFNLAGLILILIGICYGTLQIPYRTPVNFAVTSSFWIYASIFITLTPAILKKIGILSLSKHVIKLDKAICPIAFALTFYLLSDLPFRNFSFFQADTKYFAILTIAIFAATFLLSSKKYFTPWLMVATILCGISGFFLYSDSSLLFSDDHSAFLYRLIQLKEEFPQIPFYNPLWNGGVDAREFFPSGVLNLFLLGLPFIYFGDIINNYNLVIAFIVFILLPFSVFTSARLMHLSSSAASVAATLSLSSSLLFYRWALSHGTMGFIISIIMFPLLISTALKLLEKSNLAQIKIGLLVYLTFSLMIFWSLSVLFIIPLTLILLFNIKKFTSKRVVISLIFALTVTHLPWISIFAEVSDVFNFVSISKDVTSDSSIDDQRAKIRKIAPLNESVAIAALKKIRETASASNPLLLFLVIPGIFLIPRRINRIAVTSSLLWLTFIGAFGFLIKPQLELERLLLVAILLATIPAGAYCAKLIESRNDGSSAVGRVLLVACLLYSPFWLLNVTSNQTQEKYYLADSTVADLTSVLKERSSLGRSLFAGFILHELSNGHVAPLAAFSGAPLIASRYQHDRWHYVDVIPKEYRARKYQGVDEYLDLMNVATVITHERFWRGWFGKRHKKFRAIAKFKHFTVYERIGYSGSYFLKGSGRINEQRGSSVHLTLESNDAVIKFNYLPFLKTTNCTISPYPISKDISFIALSNCEKGKEIVISAQSGLSRIW